MTIQEQLADLRDGAQHLEQGYLAIIEHLQGVLSAQAAERDVMLGLLRSERDQALAARDEAREALRQVTQVAVLASLSPSAQSLKRPCQRCSRDFLIPHRRSEAKYCPACRRDLAIERRTLQNAAAAVSEERS